MLVLVVTAPAAGAELVADRLWAAGARGVEERAVTTATGVPDVELRAVLGEDRRVLARIARSLPGRPTWRVDDVDPTPAASWRDHATPVEVVPGLVVAPAWIDDPRGTAAPGGTTAPGKTTVITIEPGAAFGLGDHPTTRRTLALLVRELELRPGATVADIGCGSGVLAAAAAVSGARSVRAVDVAAAAVEATIDNARRNGVAELIQADDTPVGELDGPFEVVVANLLAPTLVALADDLRRLVAGDGTLVVSGLLANRYQHVVDALAPLRVSGVSEEDGWVAVVLRPPTRS